MSIYPAPHESNIFNPIDYDTSGDPNTDASTNNSNGDAYDHNLLVHKTGSQMSGPLTLPQVVFSDGSYQTTAFASATKLQIDANTSKTTNISILADETTIDKISTDRIILKNVNGNQTLTYLDKIQISSNKGNIQSHDTQIQSHDTQIQSHDTQIQSHDTQIQSHDTQIQSHDTKLENIIVSTLTDEVTIHQLRCDSIIFMNDTSSIEAQVATYTLDDKNMITQNSNDIAQNSSDINTLLSSNTQYITESGDGLSIALISNNKNIILDSGTSDILLETSRLILNGSMLLNNEIQAHAFRDTHYELMSHFLTHSPTEFYIYGNNRDIYLHSGSDSIMLYTNDVYIGNASSGKIHINGAVQNYAYTDSDRLQITVNKNQISGVSDETVVLSNSLITESNRISANTEKINTNTNQIQSILNNTNTGSRINTEFDFNDYNILGVYMEANKEIGNLYAYHDLDLGASIKTDANGAQFFANGIVSADFGTLNVITNINYSNLADINSYVYRLQTQVLICNSNSNVKYLTSAIQGVETTNTPSVVYSNYAVQNSQYIKYKSSYMGQYLKIRTYYRFQTVSTATVSGNVQIFQM